MLLNKPFVRCDYKELVKLTLRYVTGYFDEQYDFQCPGALHRARWMAKLIYSIKIVLFSKRIAANLPRGAVFAVGQLNKIEQFVQFSILVYVPWWMCCPVPATAPQNDLMLWNSCMEYHSTQEKCSVAATKSLKSHLWYLTEELILLTLFNDDIDYNTKDKMAYILQSAEAEYFTNRLGNGRPKMPEMPLEGKTECLSRFVGASSWSFLKKIGTNGEFLAKSAETWFNDPEYIKMKEVVDNLQVVNDAAERGVKLCSDQLKSAKSEDKFQDILQVVENARHQTPNQRKRKQDGKSWFHKL